MRLTHRLSGALAASLTLLAAPSAEAQPAPRPADVVATCIDRLQTVMSEAADAQQTSARQTTALLQRLDAADAPHAALILVGNRGADEVRAAAGTARRALDAATSRCLTILTAIEAPEVFGEVTVAARTRAIARLERTTTAALSHIRETLESVLDAPDPAVGV